MEISARRRKIEDTDWKEFDYIDEAEKAPEPLLNKLKRKNRMAASVRRTKALDDALASDNE